MEKLDRLQTKEVLFYEPIKRNRFKTKSSTTLRRKLVASHQKVIQYKTTSGFIVQIFIKSQELISTSDLMTYPSTLTPYSISTIDGYSAKNSKAKGMNHMIKDAENVLLQPDVLSFKMETLHSARRTKDNEDFIRAEVDLLQLTQYSAHSP